MRIGRLFGRGWFVVAGIFLWTAPAFLVEWVAKQATPWVAVPLGVYGCWRGATVRVGETDEGLRVRNLLRSYTLPWSEVTGVDWYEPLEVPAGFTVPGVRVRGRRWRVPVLAMVCCISPYPNDAAVVRRWAERLA